MKHLQIFALLVFVFGISSTSVFAEEDDEITIITEEGEYFYSFSSNVSDYDSETNVTNPNSPPPVDESTISLPLSDSDDVIASNNHTRCSQTQLAFTRETLLHIWEIKGLIGYISYIKRFDQPFEVKTEHVSFKSDNVDGKWSFKVYKVRHQNPFSIVTSSSPTSTSSSASSASFSTNGDVGDIRIAVTYSYEAKQPRNSDFIIRPTLIHGAKEFALPPQRSTSPTIVHQKYYNTRGYQLNSNFLEYVYTFTWANVIHHLNDIKSKLFNTKFNFESNVEASEPQKPNQAQEPNYYLHHNEEASEELFEEITRTDFSGHFGDITLKFVISAYFPSEPVSITSSRCNASVLERVDQQLLDNLAHTSKHVSGSDRGSASSFYTKEISRYRRGHGGIPPYLRYAYSMLHDDRFWDVILVVGEDELPAHRIILATSSPVFSAILENTTTLLRPTFANGNDNQSECHSSRPHLPRIVIEPLDIGVECVQEFLRYVYTGSLDNVKMKDGSLAHRLIVLADKYDMPELKRHCERILLQGLTADNAIDMYLLGAQVSSLKLTRKAMIIMKMNKATMASRTEEFRELSMRHPTLMYELFLSD